MFFDGKKFLTVEESKRYVTFNGEIKTSKKMNGEEVHTIKRFEMKLCQQVDDEVVKDLLKTGLTKTESKIDNEALFSDSVLCGEVTEEDPFLQGSKLSLPYTSHDFLIYPCSLPDPAQCASLEELSAFQIGLVQLVKVAKYSQKADPLKPALDPDTIFYVDISTRTQITNFYKMNQIYDDDIGIVGERLTQEYIDTDKTTTVTGSRLTQSVHCTKQQIATGFCEYYTKIINRSSNEKMVIERRYKQFFGVISEIGGFNDLIIIILWAVYFFYNSYSYKKMIRSQLDASLSGFGGRKESSKENLEGEAQNPSKKDGELSRKWIGKLDKNIGPLPELNLLIEINAKSRIVIEAIFGKFDKEKALKTLLPKIILNRKKISKTKKFGQEKSQNIENQAPVSNKKNPKNIHQKNMTKKKFRKNNKNCENSSKMNSFNQNSALSSQEQDPQVKMTKLANNNEDQAKNQNSQSQGGDSSSRLLSSKRRIHLGSRRKINGKNKFSVFKKSKVKSTRSRVNVDPGKNNKKMY